MLYSTLEFFQAIDFSNDINYQGDFWWGIVFSIHVFFGTTALLIGWTQFYSVWRNKFKKAHRLIGIIYICSALLSALAAIYIGLFAPGIFSAIGFVSLGFIWFYTTYSALLLAKDKKYMAHEFRMYYSYAACLSAITFRVWLPFLELIFLDTVLAYSIVAWLSWVPNLWIAHYLLQHKRATLSPKKIQTTPVD